MTLTNISKFPDFPTYFRTTLLPLQKLLAIIQCFLINISDVLLVLATSLVSLLCGRVLVHVAVALHYSSSSDTRSK